MTKQTNRAVTNILADMALKDSKGAVIDVNNPNIKGDVKIEGKVTINSADSIVTKDGSKVGGNVDGKDISPKNVSVSGKLTINSSSDIVTKDGSKVGGSSLPITNITYDEEGYPQIPKEGGYLIDYHYIDLGDSIAYGLTTSIGNKDESVFHAIAYDHIDLEDSSAYGLTTYIGNKNGTVFASNTQFIDGDYIFMYKNFASIDDRLIERFNITGLFTTNESSVKVPMIGISFVASGGGSSDSPNKSIEYIIDFSTNNDNNNITIPSGDGTLAFTKDIPTYYNHFITLKGNGTDYIICFNAYSKSSTQAKSLHDVQTICENNSYMCSGKAGTLTPYAIHFGELKDDPTIIGNGDIGIAFFDNMITDIVTPIN